MICVLSALFAELLEHDFFGRVDLVSARDVVLGLTYGTDHSECESLVFLCHRSRL